VTKPPHSRTILHVDMDAFFASVEAREDPSLVGKPVLVGGAGRRGVVAAASYEARAYGCHSAQPMAQALRLCPQAIVAPPRGRLYSAVSREVFAIFERFSPLVEGISIDEAFLDLTGTQRLLGAPRDAAEALRKEVRRETGLTCSVGIASVKFIAKIASGMNKPDGVTEVPAGGEIAFLDPLPISKLWGAGPKIQASLETRGIRTIGDLRRADGAGIEKAFGAHGRQLHRLAHAIDLRAVVPGRRSKSMSHEDTYAVDVIGVEALRKKLLSQSVRVADRLVARGLCGRRVHLKLRDSTFRTETRQSMLRRPTNESKLIYRKACEMLDAMEVEGRSFRLTGVGVGALEDDIGDPQLDLLDEVGGEERTVEARGRAVQEVQAEIRRRFGHQALFPADAENAQSVQTTGAISNAFEPED
jgi:DNA polymerase-4